jgi:hypothetical protein
LLREQLRHRFDRPNGTQAREEIIPKSENEQKIFAYTRLWKKGSARIVDQKFELKRK